MPMVLLSTANPAPGAGRSPLLGTARRYHVALWWALLALVFWACVALVIRPQVAPGDGMSRTAPALSGSIGTAALYLQRDHSLPLEALRRASPPLDVE